MLFIEGDLMKVALKKFRALDVSKIGSCATSEKTASYQPHKQIIYPNIETFRYSAVF